MSNSCTMHRMNVTQKILNSLFLFSFSSIQINWMVNNFELWRSSPLFFFSLQMNLSSMSLISLILTIKYFRFEFQILKYILKKWLNRCKIRIYWNFSWLCNNQKQKKKNYLRQQHVETKEGERWMSSNMAYMSILVYMCTV